jgi:GxxExxY protein
MNQILLKEKALTEQIIKAYYKTYNSLGYGFLEKVYENTMVIVLQQMGLHGKRQVPIKVHFEEYMVGEYFADMIVENKVILELKAAETLCKEHEAQLMNYLRATDIEIGFLFNFGTKPQFIRKVFENKYKNPRKSA